MVGRIEADVEAHSIDQARFGSRGHQVCRVLRAQCQRLLADDVLATGEGDLRLAGMNEVGSGYVNDIDLGILRHFLDALVHPVYA
jgi:hypothetical protein